MEQRMSRSNILLANDRRIATEVATRDGHDEHVQLTAPIGVGALPLVAGRYFALDGSINAAVDGATEAQNFDLQPGADEILRVHRIGFQMTMASEIDWAGFGDLGALGVGLLLQLVDADEVEISDLLGSPLKTYADLGMIFDLTYQTNESTAFVLTGRWTLPAPLRLEGADSERLRIVVRDDLSSLPRLRFRADCSLEDTLT
jgi:hypothetical protein